MKDWKRYVTGLLLMPIVIGIVYYLPERMFTYLIMGVSFLALTEYTRMFKEKKQHLFLPTLIIMLLMIEAMSNLGFLSNLRNISVEEIQKELMLFNGLKSISWFFITIIVAVVLIPTLSLLGKDSLEEKFKSMMIYLSGFFYFGLTFGLFSLIRGHGNNYHWLTFALAVPWICDTAAYFGGRFLGKHKFAPKISPNKTWEGAISGVVFSTIAGILFALFLLKSENLIHVGIVALFIGILGQTGDLVESLLKRAAGVKDSGNVFPGHGGILDRTDSLLMSVSVIYIFFLIKSYAS